MNSTASTTDTTAATITTPDAPRPRQSRAQQIAIVAAVALLIVASGVWLARSQGASDLGTGGVHSVLLPKVGEPAPEYMTLFARDGERFRLSDLKGQPVWLNFWGSWCPPCRAEMPEIEAAWQELQPRGMTMVGISLQENPDDAVAYADRVGATFPIAMDPDFIVGYMTDAGEPDAAQQLKSIAAAWQVRNFPTHVFIDKNGTVVAVILSQMTTECAVEYSELAMGERDDVSRSCRAAD
jgi:peroxiredoxin